MTELLVVLITFLIMHIGNYFFNFSTFFDIDIRLNYSRHGMRNRRKKEPNVIKRLVFWDLKDKVYRWHYVFFWIYFLSFWTALLFFALKTIYTDTIFNIIFLVFSVVYCFVSVVILFEHWGLNPFNKPISYKDYKKKYRRR